MLWGDSLTAQYRYGLEHRLDASTIHLMQMTGANCPPTLEPPRTRPICREGRDIAAGFFARATPDVVVIAGKWDKYAQQAGFDDTVHELLGAIAFLRGRGIPVIVIGPSPTFRSRLPGLLMRARNRGTTLTATDLLEPGLFDLDARLKARIPVARDLVYISMLETVCPAKACTTMLPDGTPLTFDHVHATAEGSILMSAPVETAVRQVLQSPREARQSR